MKTILTTLLLFIGLNSYSQCPLPTYQWKANKNRFEIKEVQFTPAVYLFQWKAPADNVWTSKEAKLHAVSSINCTGNGTCTYTVGVVQNTYAGALWYGVQNGWVVRFAKKCSDGTWSAFTAEETVTNVQ